MKKEKQMPTANDIVQGGAGGRTKKRNLVDRLGGAAFLALMEEAKTDGEINEEDVFFWNDSRLAKQANTGNDTDRLVTANLCVVDGFEFIDGKVAKVQLTWFNLNPETLEISKANSGQSTASAAMVWDRVRDAETVLGGLQAAFGQDVTHLDRLSTVLESALASAKEVEELEEEVVLD